MSTAMNGEAQCVRRVIDGRLERVRRGKRTAFEARVPNPAPEPGPAPVALALALAHRLRRAIDDGEIGDLAAAAQKLGITRARVTQLLDLTLLAPWIQEAVLELKDNGTGCITERRLRDKCRHRSWK